MQIKAAGEDRRPRDHVRDSNAFDRLHRIRDDVLTATKYSAEGNEGV